MPAATLLLPYFEVDFDNPNGITTLFSINNASATAAVAHVVLWSDESVPTFDFDIYLTGYDVQTISVRDIFNGSVPITADARGRIRRTRSARRVPSRRTSTSRAAPAAAAARGSGLLFVTHLRAPHTGRSRPC